MNQFTGSDGVVSGASPADREGAGGLRRPRPVDPVDHLDPAEVLRAARQMRLPELGETGQRRLAAARVAVVGAGGLGSPVLEYLAGAGIGQLTVIDPDVVDVSNLHRQVVHGPADVGRPKVESAADRVRAINPATRVRTLQATVDVDTALDLLAGHDVVLDGSDNFPTRYLVSDACEMLDLPLVWGSILGFAGQVSVFHADGGRGVTYRDVFPRPPGPGEVPSCAEAGVVPMLCGIIGSTMALEALKVLTGIGRPLIGRLALFDALTMRWQEVPLARDPQRASVDQLEDLRLTCGLPGPIPTGDGEGGEGEVAAEELAELLASGVRLIDIREPQELEAGYAAGADRIPSGRLLADPGAAGALEGAVLYCAAGSRSESARRALAERGIAVRSLRGGYAALVAAGIPIRLPDRE